MEQMQRSSDEEEYYEVQEQAPNQTIKKEAVQEKKPIKQRKSRSSTKLRPDLDELMGLSKPKDRFANLSDSAKLLKRQMDSAELRDAELEEDKKPNYTPNNQGGSNSGTPAGDNSNNDIAASGSDDASNNNQGNEVFASKEPTALQAGMIYGGFELLKPLGSGATGETWKVRRKLAGKIEKIYTLKIPHQSNSKSLRDLEREIAAVSDLTHNAVLRPVNWNLDSEEPFLAYEFIEAQSLRQDLKAKGSYSPQEALDITYQILGAVSAAHNSELTILHRDLKPANVLVTKNGIKVIDFGLAKIIDELSQSINVSLSFQSGDKKGLIGTIGYMAPEIEEGKSASPQSDLYSVAVMFYELLTGENPKRLGLDASDVIKEALEDTEKNRAIIKIIKTGLKKNPKSRYASAQAFIEALKLTEKLGIEAIVEEETTSQANADGSQSASPEPLSQEEEEELESQNLKTACKASLKEKLNAAKAIAKRYGVVPTRITMKGTRDRFSINDYEDDYFTVINLTPKDIIEAYDGKHPVRIVAEKAADVALVVGKAGLVVGQKAVEGLEKVLDATGTAIKRNYKSIIKGEDHELVELVDGTKQLYVNGELVETGDINVLGEKNGELVYEIKTDEKEFNRFPYSSRFPHCTPKMTYSEKFHNFEKNEDGTITITDKESGEILIEKCDGLQPVVLRKGKISYNTLESFNLKKQKHSIPIKKSKLRKAVIATSQATKNAAVKTVQASKHTALLAGVTVKAQLLDDMIERSEVCTLGRSTASSIRENYRSIIKGEDHELIELENGTNQLYVNGEMVAQGHITLIGEKDGELQFHHSVREYLLVDETDPLSLNPEEYRFIPCFSGNGIWHKKKDKLHIPCNGADTILDEDGNIVALKPYKIQYKNSSVPIKKSKIRKAGQATKAQLIDDMFDRSEIVQGTKRAATAIKAQLYDDMTERSEICRAGRAIKDALAPQLTVDERLENILELIDGDAKKAYHAIRDIEDIRTNPDYLARFTGVVSKSKTQSLKLLKDVPEIRAQPVLLENLCDNLESAFKGSFGQYPETYAMALDVPELRKRILTNLDPGIASSLLKSYPDKFADSDLEELRHIVTIASSDPYAANRLIIGSWSTEGCELVCSNPELLRIAVEGCLKNQEQAYRIALNSPEVRANPEFLKQIIDKVSDSRTRLYQLSILPEVQSDYALRTSIAHKLIMIEEQSEERKQRILEKYVPKRLAFPVENSNSGLLSDEALAAELLRIMKAKDKNKERNSIEPNYEIIFDSNQVQTSVSRQDKMLEDIISLYPMVEGFKKNINIDYIDKKIIDKYY